MTEYSELVKALRCKRDDCEGCDLAFFDKDEGWMCRYAAKDDDAAAAIEALEKELRESMQKCAECGDEQEQKVKGLQARLGEAENSAERWKDMYLTKQLPKRGEWLPYEFNTNGTWHKCSVCGVAYQYKDAPNSGWWINHNYCPNCGAKMNGEQNVE